MRAREPDVRRGLEELRWAVARALGVATTAEAGAPGWLFADSLSTTPGSAGDAERPGGAGGAAGAVPEAEDAESQRIVALVDQARAGDVEAFGRLYDHYHPSVYRFLYYRMGSVALAEDLTADTFFRALRSVATFRWQGKDFGAWLTTIARNLATDHVKSARARLETVVEDLSDHDTRVESPEDAVMASLTNQALLKALRRLPAEQQDCLVLRFLQGMSLAETAAVLERSVGAVKQLQLRSVRNLAKALPADPR